MITRAAEGFLLGFICAFVTSGCFPPPARESVLMPAPLAVQRGQIDPFSGFDGSRNGLPVEGPFYVTDRGRSEENGAWYGDVPGPGLRVGRATVRIAGSSKVPSWTEISRISRLEDRKGENRLTLSVPEIREFGVLEETMLPAAKAETIANTEFARRINEKLRASRQRDIYIYVHGYRVTFENPILISTELWHYLGYDGAFIAYSWPSAGRLFSYFSDLENTRLSARNLDILLSFLADNTIADEVHLIGYSTGSRVIFGALERINLRESESTARAIQNEYRIGHVIVAASDYDLKNFAGALEDGILRLPKNMTIYFSSEDRASELAAAVLFKSPRLGSSSSAITENYKNRLDLIDVTDAAGAEANSGHGYFRMSPAVSGDVLLKLGWDLGANERGLLRNDRGKAWHFSGD